MWGRAKGLAAKSMELTAAAAEAAATNISQAVAAAAAMEPIDEFVNAWRQIDYLLHEEDIPMGAPPRVPAAKPIAPGAWQVADPNLLDFCSQTGAVTGWPRVCSASTTCSARRSSSGWGCAARSG